jgi:hypothetical protein
MTPLVTVISLLLTISPFVPKRLAFLDKVFPLVISTGCHVYHFVKQNVIVEDVVVLLTHYVIVACTFQTTLGSPH